MEINIRERNECILLPRIQDTESKWIHKVLQVQSIRTCSPKCHCIKFTCQTSNRRPKTRVLLSSVHQSQCHWLYIQSHCSIASFRTRDGLQPPSPRKVNQIKNHSKTQGTSPSKVDPECTSRRNAYFRKGEWVTKGFPDECGQNSNYEKNRLLQFQVQSQNRDGASVRF